MGKLRISGQIVCLAHHLDQIMIHSKYKCIQLKLKLTEFCILLQEEMHCEASVATIQQKYKRYKFDSCTLKYIPN